MQSAGAGRSAFASGLRTELAGFRELHQILLAEQECLLRADAEALVELIEVKARQIERLHALAGQRAGYLGTLALNPGGEGMRVWLASHAGADQHELSLLWQQLVEAAAEARTLNDRNGGLIGARLNHNQAALAALQAAARSLSTYGPDGQSQLRAGQRELGRA